MSTRNRGLVEAAFSGGFSDHNSCSRASVYSLVLGGVEDHLTPEITKVPFVGFKASNLVFIARSLMDGVLNLRIL